MELNNRTTDTEKCTHCGICRKNCSFLNKYGINIGDTQRLGELAYHCFLCGKCTEVCPEGIDGREVILNMRRKIARENNGRPEGKGYGMLLLEKKNYLFSNYRSAAGRSVLFPGCNFPSFYPETTKKLAKLLKEKADIGVIYDCCGKPIAELGMEAEEKSILERLTARLNENGVTEIITMCPNCYHFLKGRLPVNVVSVYEKLAELRVGETIEGEGELFLPCPDRAEGEMLKSIRPFVKRKFPVIEDVQCCGLGGCAMMKEQELSMSFAKELASRELPCIYTYCASCSGSLKRGGCQNVRHVLAEILGTNEEPDIRSSLRNRMKSKFW